MLIEGTVDMGSVTVDANRQPPRTMADVPPDEHGITHQQWLEHQAARIFSDAKDRRESGKKQTRTNR